ncbi:MAG: hypothetical protein ACPL7K_05775, partial [Armatimonadota bacterium]
MADSGIDRRGFLQIAAAGAAASLINTTSPEASAMADSMAKESRTGAIFCYGYHEAPYKLEPGPHLFIDWRYVDPGRVRWTTTSGETPLFAHEEVKDVHGVLERVPYGLRLVPQEPEKIGPVIRSDRDWEFMIYAHTLLDLGGKYGLWYEALPPKQAGPN